MDDVLMKSVEESDDFFCGMVDLIHPDHFGFDEDIRNHLKEAKHEMVEKKLRSDERLKLKAHGKQLLSRLDVDGTRTVTQIWSWLADQKPSKSENPIPKNAPIGKKKGLKNQPRADLLVKLQSKVDAMRKNRKAEFSDFKKLSNKNKRTNNPRTKSNSNKPIPIENGGSTNETETKSSSTDLKPTIKNVNGETVYSKFDFSIFGVKSNEKKKSKTNKSLTGKDYKKLLETVEKRDEKLAKMKLENPEKALEIEKKLHWDAAIDRAHGIKVKDDKQLLKQNLKRKEKHKKSSENQWKQRDEKLEQKMQKRQDDRNRNLKKRKVENKQKKLDKARKKGRLVPSKI